MLCSQKERLMEDLDNQKNYWNRVGPTKPFSHLVNVSRLAELIDRNSHILDFGCGYGRALGALYNQGYHNLIGVDPAPSMVEAARQKFPQLPFLTIDPPHLPFADGSMDVVLLFAVLTCVPSDEGQRRIIREISRVLRHEGLLYISDFWLQKDERNVERYRRSHAKYGVYGIFELPEGVVLRHHERRWIHQLTADFTVVTMDEVRVETMNGHGADAFQWFGRKGRPT
jgi:SAM-dependent methyltransferase